MANFNSCAKTVFSQSQSSLLEQIQSTAIILINKDAPYTNSAQVELTLESMHANEVYVTNDATCASGGSWEPMSNLKNWTLSLKNQESPVFAKFRNVSEGLETSCLSDAIVHDDVPPEVSLQEPRLVTNVTAPVFQFLAGDAVSGLEKTTCQWPNQAEPVVCDFASSNGALAEGRYLVKVVAHDRAGNVSDPVVQDLLVDRTKPTVTFLSGPPSVGKFD